MEEATSSDEIDITGQTLFWESFGDKMMQVLKFEVLKQQTDIK